MAKEKKLKAVRVKKGSWKDALEQRIYKSLSKVVFGPNGLEYKTLIENIEPSVEQILAEKNSYIERRQIIMTISDRIYRTFSMFDGRPSSTLSFTDHFGKKEVQRFTSELAKYFHSLPRDYILVAQLPQLAGLDCMNLDLTTRVSAIECTEKLPGRRLSDLVKPESAIEQIFRKRATETQTRPTEMAGPGFYLKTTFRGFGSTSFDNNAVREAIDRLKQTLFLLHIEGVIEIEPHPGSFSSIESKVFIMDFISKKSEVEEVHIPESLKVFLSRLKLDCKRKAKIDGDREEYEKSSGKQHTLLGAPSEPKPYLFLDSSKCRKIVDFDNDNKNAIAFKNALVWGFDSLMNEYDPVMSFVQLSIALEAILGGDSGRVDKTALLADRCAFMIGNNRHKRSEIRKAFSDFYKVRSELVHGEKTKLDSSVSGWKHWGEWVLQSVLRRELLFCNFDPPKTADKR
jgi:hypothetical protein